MTEMTNEETQASRTPGKYVVIYRTGGDEVDFAEAETKKAFVALLNDLVAKGNKVTRVYTNAKHVQHQVKQAVSF